MIDDRCDESQKSTEIKKASNENETSLTFVYFPNVRNADHVGRIAKANTNVQQVRMDGFQFNRYLVMTSMLHKNNCLTKDERIS